MANDINLSKAGRSIQGLTEIAESERKKLVEKVIYSLRVIENKDSMGGNSPKHYYMINYRIGTGSTELLGDSGSRRASLTEVIKSLKSHDYHISTSSWTIETYIKSARDILDQLKFTVDDKFDFLSVTEITLNRVFIGDAKLES